MFSIILTALLMRLNTFAASNAPALSKTFGMNSNLSQEFIDVHHSAHLNFKYYYIYAIVPTKWNITSRLAKNVEKVRLISRVLLEIQNFPYCIGDKIILCKNAMGGTAAFIDRNH